MRKVPQKIRFSQGVIKFGKLTTIKTASMKYERKNKHKISQSTNKNEWVTFVKCCDFPDMKITRNILFKFGI